MDTETKTLRTTFSDEIPHFSSWKKTNNNIRS